MPSRWHRIQHELGRQREGAEIGTGREHRGREGERRRPSSAMVQRGGMVECKVLESTLRYGPCNVIVFIIFTGRINVEAAESREDISKGSRVDTGWRQV